MSTGLSPSPPQTPITAPTAQPNAPKFGLTVSTPWLQFFNRIVEYLGTIVDAAGALEGDGTAGNPLRVRVDGVTIVINGSNNLEAVFSGIVVDVAGALDGDGTLGDPLAVRVDGATIIINGSNQLEAVFGGVTVAVAGALDGDGTAGNPLAVRVDNTSIEVDGSDNLSLKATAVTPGTYGDASNVAQVTVDTDGRVTAASNVPISASAVGGQPEITQNVGDGVTVDFSLPDFAAYLLMVAVAGAVMDPAADYTLSSDGGTVTFTAAPANLAVIVITYVPLS